MKVSTTLTVFYCLATFFLAVTGAWLLFAPQSFIVLLHGGDHLVISPLLSQQTALGLLLAAAVNLVCLVGGPSRLPLHAAVLIYLAGLVASHGAPAFGGGAWLWIPVALYLLPLLPWRRLGRDQRRQGEVKWFNPNKGFGFILADNGEEIFVHFKAVRNGGRRSLRTGSRVRFTTRMSERGEQADQVYIEQ
ncbi:cold-shock protein [Alloalcanivorax mobilis]|uniref:cold-shock protein n=1 Tax=Alloalcanivorax mobilis TaxID=2019569 RepID=UPI000B5B309C|nr:cold shock domain-containing protein [Alloalcanivorax mobilis]ASK33146.1 cold-shock protein [Alcanivorax sp. N3-2A]ASK36964.1 cold-shock protein [Alcanivorax sp. N3-2A]|tara:strand:+ start:38209 stop:38781 length:573 start_codon:yes stop_codon:yes gene_type:complete